MNPFLRSLILTAIAFTAPGAFAQTEPVVLETSQLMAVELTPDLLGAYSFKSGRVELEYFSDAEGAKPEFIKLVIERKKDCAPDQMCTREMPAPIFVRLPVTKVTFESCGGSTFEAELDDSRLDGSKQTLQVFDSRKSTCAIRVGGPTQVVYTVSIKDMRTGVDHTSLYRFEGSALKRLHRID